MNNKLNNPPIIEALIDLRLTYAEQIDVIDFEKAYQMLGESRYSKKESIYSGSVRFKIDPKGQMNSSSKKMADIIGYKFTDEDRGFILQLTLAGFTLSKIKPYENWEHLKEEAVRCWNILIGIKVPSVIHRLAVRYINRIEMPPVPFKVEEYLLFRPEIPDYKEENINEYGMQISMPQNDINSVLILQQSMRRQSDKKIMLVLDIDLYKSTKYSVKDIDKILEDLELLRERKNLIFFGSFTDSFIEELKCRS